MNQRTFTSRCHRPGLNPRQASVGAGFASFAGALVLAAWALFSSALAGPLLPALAEPLDVLVFGLCDAGFGPTVVEPRSFVVRFIGSHRAFVAYQAVVHLWGA